MVYSAITCHEIIEVTSITPKESVPIKTITTKTVTTKYVSIKTIIPKSIRTNFSEKKVIWKLEKYIYFTGLFINYHNTTVKSLVVTVTSWNTNQNKNIYYYTAISVTD